MQLNYWTISNFTLLLSSYLFIHHFLTLNGIDSVLKIKDPNKITYKEFAAMADEISSGVPDEVKVWEYFEKIC